MVFSLFLQGVLCPEGWFSKRPIAWRVTSDMSPSSKSTKRLQGSLRGVLADAPKRVQNESPESKNR